MLTRLRDDFGGGNSRRGDPAKALYSCKHLVTWVDVNVIAEVDGVDTSARVRYGFGVNSDKSTSPEETRRNAATLDDVIAGRAPYAVSHGDALALFASAPDGAFDAIVSDPPYASTGDAASVMTTRDGAMSVPREWQFYEAWLREHVREWSRVLKPTGAVWMTIDWRGAMCLDLAAHRLGLKPPVVGVWDRGGLGMGNVLRKTYECFAILPRVGWKRRKMDEPDGFLRAVVAREPRHGPRRAETRRTRSPCRVSRDGCWRRSA